MLPVFTECVSVMMIICSTCHPWCCITSLMVFRRDGYWFSVVRLTLVRYRSQTMGRHWWRFHYSIRQTITNGGPDPRCPGQTRVMFRLRQPVDPFHALKTVKGLLYLVPSRTPRSSGYGVLCTCVLCYMLFLLYV